MLCSTLAAVGGILAAARLASANQGSGTGDVNLNAIAAAVIGGASLFGGRGSAQSALLGIVVIQSISSGLTLLNLSSAIRFEVTGAVLLLAVALDSVPASRAAPMVAADPAPPAAGKIGAQSTFEGNWYGQPCSSNDRDRQDRGSGTA